MTGEGMIVYSEFVAHPRRIVEGICGDGSGRPHCFLWNHLAAKEAANGGVRVQLEVACAHCPTRLRRWWDDDLELGQSVEMVTATHVAHNGLCFRRRLMLPGRRRRR